MSQFQPESTGQHPPILPEVPMTAQDLRWPSWFGGISIAYGGLMVLAICCGSFGLLAAQFAGKLSGADFPGPPKEIGIIFAIDAVISIVLGAMLLLGGIALLRRRAKGRVYLVRFAVARVVLAVPLFVAAWWQMKPQAIWQANMAQAQVDMMKKSNPNMTIPQATLDATKQTDPSVLQKAMVVGGSALGLIFPVVILLMLTQPAYKDDTASWEP
ncbi:MAG: hypothetical protein U0625_10075 [Phycisphaerales bacterium]